MKPSFLFFAFTFLYSTTSIAANVCNIDIKFETKPAIKQQTVKVAEGIDLFMTQMLATKSSDGAKIASNLICQKMIGTSYTGTEQEWQYFLESALKGLLAAGFKDVQVTAITATDKIYKGAFGNVEYSFVGVRAENKQHFYNLAILDKINNTVYTLSVSGNERAQAKIKNEFERMVNSLIIKS